MFALSLSLSMLDKGSLKLPLHEEQLKLSCSHLWFDKNLMFYSSHDEAWLSCWEFLGYLPIASVSFWSVFTAVVQSSNIKVFVILLFLCSVILLCYNCAIFRTLSQIYFFCFGGRLKNFVLGLSFFCNYFHFIFNELFNFLRF